MLQARDDALRSSALKCISDLLKNDPANYFILEDQHPLAILLEKYDTLSPVRY
jgi:hypothetical protein